MFLPSEEIITILEILSKNSEEIMRVHPHFIKC